METSDAKGADNLMDASTEQPMEVEQADILGDTENPLEPSDVSMDNVTDVPPLANTMEKDDESMEACVTNISDDEKEPDDMLEETNKLDEPEASTENNSNKPPDGEDTVDIGNELPESGAADETKSSEDDTEKPPEDTSPFDDNDDELPEADTGEKQLGSLHRDKSEKHSEDESHTVVGDVLGEESEKELADNISDKPFEGSQENPSDDSEKTIEKENIDKASETDTAIEGKSSDESNTRKQTEGENTMDIAEISMDDFRGDTVSVGDEDNDPIADSEKTMAQDKTDISVNIDEQNSDSTLTGPYVEEEAREDESILPEEEQEKEGKYVITHFNENEEKLCGICEKTEVPKYLAQKQVESLYICNNDCLEVFKNKNSDNYIEKILRLRAFANQDKKVDVAVVVAEDENEEEVVAEVEDEFGNSSPQKCKQCKKSIDLKYYISWEAADYCHEGCLLNFQRTINPTCAKCKIAVTEDVIGKFCVRFGNVIIQFCSTNCLLSYKRSYKFCSYCQGDLRECTTRIKTFCSKRCQEACLPEHVIKDKSYCAVCHQMRQVEVKIRIANKFDSFCGEPCLVAYKFVNQVDPVKCHTCSTHFEPQSDDPVIYNEGVANLLCSVECQKIYLIMNRKIVVCSHCNVKKYDFDMIKLYESGKMLIACSNSCLQVYFNKSYKDQVEKLTEPNIKQLEMAVKDGDFMVKGKNLSFLIKCALHTSHVPFHRITLSKPKAFVKQKNVATMCQPTLVSKAISCRTRDINVETQTDPVTNRLYIPVPCPIYVPVPLHMYVQAVPFFFPIPLPLPVPIFIPTARKSIAGILKEIQKIKNRVPADPLEAELLMMAEMAAGDKKEESSSESEPEEAIKPEEPFPAERIDTSPAFGEDMLTMALKMASDFEEPVDLEGVVAPTTIPPQPFQESIDAAARIENIMDTERKPVIKTKSKPKRTETTPPTAGAAVPASTPMDVEKSDSNLSLKFTFGVNAWKQWVTIKNLELQKTMRRPKLFKSDILQLTADDLNFSLCLFVKEVRKPNGADYAPDTIYYLCLGIQQFLYENGRIDNIFCDAFYDKFTDTFNEVCQKFANLYNDSQYIVTRVEEEHLWESKQLGAHSPLVLLNTLMFFNTKHFSLTTVDMHLQLSFSHIMKHWKRNPNQPGARNVLLRFYPPQNSQGRKKKVFEQQENDVNPLRCPVKLYEFYLSKCPESVKTRNDVFYLQPERSCVPDSPVWYSTMAIEQIALEKMLNRIKMVKEINVALLTT